MGMLIQNLLNVFFYFFPLIHTFSLISSSGATRIEIINNCSYTVWAAATPGGGQRLKQGETWLLRNVSSTGRIWGRTKCTFGSSGTGGKCKSGDCEGRLKCETNGRPPITVAEYSLNQVNNDDNVDVFYISVVEGFNVPMEFRPSEVSSDCSQVSRCAGEVNGACPTELIDPEGCNNPCTVFRNNQFCCTSGNICEPTSYSKFFKDLCQEAFTYPSDVGLRSTCPTGKDYKVVFCPTISYTGMLSLLSHNSCAITY
ncbi:thaumatin-like protein 1 [Morus notabilis]|uniref:thaumatin-like protein 1 n=1 Tax=Morus notabilis TaxID=981085 RepID=UPI000CED74CD|nr:thaumatin-like protein 1 [Morus notabilis]